MNSKEYGKLLKDPRWQKKRLEILERDEFRCVDCTNDEETLHVHHKHYEYGKNPWEYDNSMLITLCESCHECATSNEKEFWPLLVKNIKSKFYGDSFRELALVFSCIPILKTKEITTSALVWFFVENNGMEFIEDRYFSNLIKRREQETNICSTKRGTKKNISEDCNRKLKTENCNQKTENNKPKTRIKKGST